MKVLRNVLLVRTEHVIPQFIGCCADPLEEADQILSQSFKSAEKYVVRISEHVVETEGIVADSGAANSAHCLFGNVRNVSPVVVNLLGQHLDQNIESFVVDTEIQEVSNATYKTEPSVLAHPGDQYARGISGPHVMIQ